MGELKITKRQRANKYREAAEYIEAYGLKKCSWGWQERYDDNYGLVAPGELTCSMCAAGAFAYVVGAWGPGTSLVVVQWRDMGCEDTACVELMGEDALEGDWGISLEEFNDLQDTTQKDVCRALRLTAAIIEHGARLPKKKPKKPRPAHALKTANTVIVEPGGPGTWPDIQPPDSQVVAFPGISDPTKS